MKASGLNCLPWEMPSWDVSGWKERAEGAYWETGKK